MKFIFFNGKYCILIQISQNMISKGPTDDEQDSIGSDNGLLLNKQ